MKWIDPLVTGYERGTFEERSARTELSPRQSRKNSEDDSRANNNIRETLRILSEKKQLEHFSLSPCCNQTQHCFVQTTSKHIMAAITPSC